MFLRKLVAYSSNYLNFKFIKLNYQLYKNISSKQIISEYYNPKISKIQNRYDSSQKSLSIINYDIYQPSQIEEEEQQPLQPPQQQPPQQQLYQQQQQQQQQPQTQQLQQLQQLQQQQQQQQQQLQNQQAPIEKHQQNQFEYLQHEQQQYQKYLQKKQHQHQQQHNNQSNNVISSFEKNVAQTLSYQQQNQLNRQNQDDQNQDRLKSRRKIYRFKEKNTLPHDFVPLRKFFWSRYRNETLKRSRQGMLHTFDFEKRPNLDTINVIVKDLLPLNEHLKNQLKYKADKSDDD